MSTVKNDVECPVYETPSFTLRPTGEGKEICFWQREYEEHKYVRFAVIPKIGGEAAGTLVISGGKEGILRWEFSPDYDREACMEELIRLAVLYFIRDFQMESLKVKVSDTPENIPLLRKYGFVPSETLQGGEEYYEMRIRALHSVDWPAVSAEKTEPAPGVEREAAETEKPAEIISAAVQRDWRAAGHAVISPVMLPCWQNPGSGPLPNMWQKTERSACWPR